MFEHPNIEKFAVNLKQNLIIKDKMLQNALRLKFQNFQVFNLSGVKNLISCRLLIGLGSL